MPTDDGGLTVHDFRYYARQGLPFVRDGDVDTVGLAEAADETLAELASLAIAPWMVAEVMGWDLETAIRSKMADVMRHGHRDNESVR